MSEEYDTNEYLITNNDRIFGGNALDFMTTIHKAEQLPVRIRLYAASKSVEFERDKSGHPLEDIREQVRRELMEADKDDDWKEKFEARLFQASLPPLEATRTFPEQRPADRRSPAQRQVHQAPKLPSLIPAKNSSATTTDGF